VSEQSLRASILIDPERPKVKRGEVLATFKKAGVHVTQRNPEVGVVVGGDGIFSDYGRLISIPLLFVGVRSTETTASKGYLAEVHFDRLAEALNEIKQKRYRVVEYKRLRVSINGTMRGEVFTDVYLEKGADSNCLRYHLDIKGERLAFTDSAIANGVIISTSAGSTGYYSYIDRLRRGDRLEPDSYSLIGAAEVGVCHIAPVLTAREGTTDYAPLRYTVPWGASFELTLTRDADARLFGVIRSRKGIRIRVGDVIGVRPSKNTTRVIRLAPGFG
jgi:NAD+ kinase